MKWAGIHVTVKKEAIPVGPLILCGILAALSNCSPRQAKDRGVAQAPGGALRGRNAVLELPPQARGLALPTEGDMWVVVVSTTAGFSGDGAGGVAITSQGGVAAWHPSTEYRHPCRAELGGEAVRAVAQSTTSASPERWSASYVNPERPQGVADDLGTELVLYLRKANGVEKHVSRWHESASHTRPKDLAALHEAALKIQSQVLGSCVEPPQGSKGG
ncbi:MAG TPA: hypothetical protein VF240_17185 [Pyrinomonadaceae bacterium]